MTIWYMQDGPTTAESALRLGALARKEVSESRPVVAYGASLSDRAFVLGRYQPEVLVNHAVIANEGFSILRRSTGGPASLLSPGVLYVAVGLRTPSELIDTPPHRVLNRNVRGFLSGLRKAGFIAHYFGRETISVNHRPVGLVAWDRDLNGRVLLELFLSLTEPFAHEDSFMGYPARLAARWLGKEPITLAQVRADSIDPAAVLKAIFDGFGVCYGRRLEPFLEMEELRSKLGDSVIPRTEDEELVWSVPREIPIGFLRAGLALDRNGKITKARLSGDFYQEQRAQVRLEQELHKRAPTTEVFRHALNRVFGEDGCVLEGVADPTVVLESLVEAVSLSKKRME